MHGGGHLPLGISDDSIYSQTQQTIATGQVLVIATDGIREASNRYGEFFGKDAFYQVIRRNAEAGASGILNAVFNAVDLFQYGNKAEDDMTLVVVKVVEDNT